MGTAAATDAAYYEQSDLWGAAHVENAAHLELRFAAIEALLPTTVRSVVEVGSGDGRVLDHLAARGRISTAIAVDRSLTALRHQGRPAVAGSIDCIPLASRGADLVLCCEVLEHLGYHVFGAARSELARLADRWVLVTVPNRENRHRGAVRCSECGCEYSPIRHLRSFDPTGLRDLLPGFRLVEVTEAGPRVVLYPRWMRWLLERIGLVHRSGSPVCPQCDAPLLAGGDAEHDSPRQRQALRTTGGLARRLVPKARRRYWLCALYEREA